MIFSEEAWNGTEKNTKVTSATMDSEETSISTLVNALF